MTKKETRQLIYSFCRAITVMRYEEGQHSVKIDKEKVKNKEVTGIEYNFIPSHPIFLEAVEAIIKKERIKKDAKIIDLGCGVSPVLVYLYLLGYENLYGIENEKTLWKGLSALFGSYVDYISYKGKSYLPNNILKGNLLDLSGKEKKIIENSDVIYMYQPIANNDKYIEMVDNVIKEMKSGAIIMDFHGPLHGASKCKEILEKKSIILKYIRDNRAYQSEFFYYIKR